MDHKKADQSLKKLNNILAQNKAVIESDSDGVKAITSTNIDQIQKRFFDDSGLLIKLREILAEGERRGLTHTKEYAYFYEKYIECERRLKDQFGSRS